MDDKEAKRIMREFKKIRKDRDKYLNLCWKTPFGSREYKIYNERYLSARKALEEMADLRVKAFAFILTPTK